MTLFQRWDIRIGLALSIIALLTALGYNVKASLPPTRAEVEEKISILRDALKNTDEMVQLNTDDRLMQRWKFLHMKLEHEGLPPHEMVEYCGPLPEAYLSSSTRHRSPKTFSTTP